MATGTSGVPVAAELGTFELTPDMLSYYGTAIPAPDGTTLPQTVTLPDGTSVLLPDTALAKGDGVIPDEPRMYQWIKAAFQHFFNNVQKDPLVQAQGLRACRQLLAYLLREINIQRQRLLDGQPVDDTMLTRLLLFQMGRSAPTVARPPDLDPRLVSDLRIAENVMGTIVGAIAGQEEATCRVIDSIIRLQEGEYRTSGSGATGTAALPRPGSWPINVLSGIKRKESRAELYKYFLEAIRLQPQGEVLLRKCARDGAQIAGQPADLRRDAGLRLPRFGDERRARTGRVHSRPAARALPASTDGAATPASGNTCHPSSSSSR